MGTATTEQNDIPVHTECFYCNLRWNDDKQLKKHIPFCVVFFFYVTEAQKQCVQVQSGIISMSSRSHFADMWGNGRRIRKQRVLE